MTGETYWRELVSGRRCGSVDRLLLLGLRVVALLYGGLLRCRARGYRTGFLRSRNLDRPVISVGNLAVGGTGKTPLTMLLARLLAGQGRRVAILSRGYGGSYGGRPRIASDGRSILMTAGEAGDEPLLLARELPGVAVVVGHDRYEAGRLAERELDPDVFLLDDGFQHLGLRRDLDILLLDGRNPFESGRVLPAGLLREPAPAARRADLIVLSRCGEGEPLPAALPAGVPVLASRHLLTGVTPVEGGECRPLSYLYGEQVFAFAGIAEPQRFFAGLAEAGVPLVGSLSLPDHARYDQGRVEGLRRLFRGTGATCFVTTAKDAVKLEPWRKILGRVWVARLELVLIDPAALEEGVAGLFQGRGGTP